MMESPETYWADLGLLDWQIALGADEAITDAPIDRYALEAAAPAATSASPPMAKVPSPSPAATPGPAPAMQPQVTDAQAAPVAHVADVAEAAQDLTQLQAALAGLTQCTLSRGARSTVFARGLPEARVMILTEPPSREDDRAGVPFAGPDGPLFDKMFAAIGLAVADAPAERALYVVPAIPWRIPGDEQPSPDDMALLTPFLKRHIALANPDVLVLLGHTSCQMLLGRGGVARLRGNWTEVLGRPALPMIHPRQLMSNPGSKRDAWADLLSLNARLKGS